MYTKRWDEQSLNWGGHYERENNEKEPLVIIEGGGGTIDFAASLVLSDRQTKAEADMEEHTSLWDERVPDLFAGETEDE